MVIGLINILNNAWFISIVTGILVYFITNLINNFKNNKEYRNNINQVTKDIVIMLQEFIVENKLPDKNILISYFKASCKKHNVRIKDSNSLIEILDLLTKEILDSKFLSSKNKLDYSNTIGSFKESLIEKNISAELKEDDRDNKEKEMNLSISKMKRQFFLLISFSISYITLMYLLSNTLSTLTPIFYFIIKIFGVLITLSVLMILFLYFVERPLKK